MYILKELKFRLLYILISILCCLFILFIYKEQLLYFIIKPSLIFLNPYFIYTQLSEVFWVFYKIIFFCSIISILPYLFIQIILFLSPGLYNKELKFVCKLFIIIGVLMYLYFYIFLSILVPYFCQFFLTFEQKGYLYLINIFFEGRLIEYLDLFFYIYLLFITLILIFSLFYILSLFIKFEYIYIFIQKRKYIYLIMLVINTLLISYDIFSLLILHFGCICVFELFNLINIVSFFYKKNKLYF